jgi:hypothetical protein
MRSAPPVYVSRSPAGGLAGSMSVNACFRQLGSKRRFAGPAKFHEDTDEINPPVRFDGGPATNQRPDFSVESHLFDAGLTRIELKSGSLIPSGHVKADQGGESSNNEMCREGSCRAELSIARL